MEVTPLFSHPPCPRARAPPAPDRIHPGKTWDRQRDETEKDGDGYRHPAWGMSRGRGVDIRGTPSNIWSGTGTFWPWIHQRKGSHASMPSGLCSNTAPRSEATGRAETQGPDCHLQPHATIRDWSRMTSPGPSPSDLLNRFWTGLLAKTCVWADVWVCRGCLQRMPGLTRLFPSISQPTNPALCQCSPWLTFQQSQAWTNSCAPTPSPGRPAPPPSTLTPLGRTRTCTRCLAPTVQVPPVDQTFSPQIPDRAHVS